MPSAHKWRIPDPFPITTPPELNIYKVQATNFYQPHTSSKMKTFTPTAPKPRPR